MSHGSPTFATEPGRACPLLRQVADSLPRPKAIIVPDEARVPFELPRGDALGERLASVLEVVYLIFNEGYTATAGDDWMRPALCDEALRLGRMPAGGDRGLACAPARARAAGELA